MKHKFIFAIVAAMLLLSGCVSFRIGTNNQTVGSGNIEAEERTVQGFDQVRLAGSGHVYIELGDTESLTVEADDNILPLITTEVKGDTLVIGLKPNTGVITTKPMIFHVTMKELSGLDLSGSGKFIVDEADAGSLALDINGSGDIEIGEVQADSIDASIDGSGNISLNGTVTSEEIRIGGSGNYIAENLQCQDANVQVLGSGDVTVWVEDELSVNIAGSGDVNYYGDPKSVDASTPGSGDTHNRGDK